MVAILVALNGILSLLDSVGAAGWVNFDRLSDSQSIIGGTASVVSAVLGLALLHRAHGLWNLKRSAWAATLLLLGFRGIVAALFFVVSPDLVHSWLGLILPFVGLLYLLKPDVRALFRAGGDAD